ncbi:Uncharacterised protein [Candidatus Tiddalikarchaeum anstoanum]|nr:Uncharacterised protein [Candidatus Tiddalikarchaeum anstoanum]
MKNYLAKNVDEYIANAQKEAQPKLKELRAAIKSAVPKAEEGISWGVPFYKYHGVLAGFASFKNHVSFGFAALLQSENRKTLEKKGYITGKKIIQIKFDQKVPTTIKQILKTKAKMNEIPKKNNQELV